MAKLVYNHAAMVADYNMISDATLSNQEKNFLVGL